MTSLERKLLHRVQCLCKRIEDLENSETGGGNNIYNFSDSLTGDRELNGLTLWSLNFTGLTDFSLDSTAGITMGATTDFYAYGAKVKLFSQSSNLEVNFANGDSIELMNDVPHNTNPGGIIASNGAGIGELEYLTPSELGTLLGVGAGSFTAGSVLFTDTDGSITEDNTNFFWDDTNNRLNLGVATGTGKLNFPDAGTTSADGIQFGTGLANLYRYTANQLVTEGSLIIGEKTSYTNGAGLAVRGNGGVGKVEVFRASNNVIGTYINSYKARGTQLVPLGLNTGDEISLYQSYAYDGAAYNRVGFFGFLSYNSVTKKSNFTIIPSNDAANGYFKLTPSAEATLFAGYLGGSDTTPALSISQDWNTTGKAQGIKFSVVDNASQADSRLLMLQAGALGTTSVFTVLKTGRTTIAETVEFSNNLTNNATPTGFLTLSGAMNGTVQYSTVGNLQTALGIGAGALTAGYVAYGTGSGITGEAELFYDSTNNRLGLSTVTPSSKIDITTNSLGTTQDNTSGLSLVNTTVAAPGAQQISPALRLQGQGWKTNATAASQAVDFRMHVLPVQGSTAPSGNLVIASGIDNTFTDRYTFGSGGTFTAGGLISISLTGTSSGRMGIISVFGMALTVPNSNGLYIGSGAADVGAEAKVKILGDTTTTTGVNGVLKMTQTWNTATNPTTAVLLDITNTSSHASSLLMDLQVGGVSQFKVDKVGAITALTSLTTNTIAGTGGTITNFSTISSQSGGSFSIGSRSRIWSPVDGEIRLTNNLGTDFTYLYLGGTTALFPTIKRVSAGIEFKLADNSAYTTIAASKAILTNTVSLISTGAAATAGTATLVGGTVTVNTTAMTATAILNYNRKTAGGVLGNLTYTQVDNTSFTITSDNALDTSVIVWNIIETY